MAICPAKGRIQVAGWIGDQIMHFLREEPIIPQTGSPPSEDIPLHRRKTQNCPYRSYQPISNKHATLRYLAHSSTHHTLRSSRPETSTHAPTRQATQNLHHQSPYLETHRLLVLRVRYSYHIKLPDIIRFQHVGVLHRTPPPRPTGAANDRRMFDANSYHNRWLFPSLSISHAPLALPLIVVRYPDFCSMRLWSFCCISSAVCVDSCRLFSTPRRNATSRGSGCPRSKARCRPRRRTRRRDRGLLRIPGSGRADSGASARLSWRFRRWSRFAVD